MPKDKKNNLAVEAIRKKLVGKKLSYKEIYAIMDEVANDRLGDVLTTYFVASGYSEGFSNDEIYYLTRAMVETGERLNFYGIVADKHSIGGTPGTRTTLIVVPIVAAAGYTIPKSSSRAITTPAGTADCMEVLSKVTFTKEQIYNIVKKTNGCIVWGGSFKIAPADDEIIKIEEPLLFESYDKVLVSVMAKKIAFGSNHVVIDIPWGKTVKVHKKEDAEIFANKFKYLSRRFDIKLETYVHKVEEPAGNGVGPLLETRDAMMVLEREKDRPMALEERALDLAGMLLDLCLEGKKPDGFTDGRNWAQYILESGAAYEKMREIITAQHGDPYLTSRDLHPAPHKGIIRAGKSGKITLIDNKNITVHAKLLGAPFERGAGMFLHKRLGDTVKKGEILVTLYSENEYRIRESHDSLELFPLYEIE